MGDLRFQPSERPWTAAFVRLVEKASLISLHDVSWLLGYGLVVLADLSLTAVELDVASARLCVRASVAGRGGRLIFLL